MLVDFEMYAGDSKVIRFECIDEDAGGIPIQLVNAQDMNFSINIFGGGADSKVVTKTLSAIGVENTNFAVINLSPTDTEELHGKYQYYFQVQDFGGKKFTKSGLCLIKINGI